MIRLRPYDDTALEYYEAERHPTSSNFRFASVVALRRWLRQVQRKTGWICEVGAGRSVLAELSAGDGALLSRLLITDSSMSMLDHSSRWVNRGPRLLLSDARSLPFVEHSLEALIAVLGDSYNVPAFWSEVGRVLNPGALTIFTTPSYEWASRYRATIPGGLLKTRFDLRDGSELIVDSFIHHHGQQIELIESSGLLVKETVHIPLSVLPPESLSPKLQCLGTDDPVVSAYFAISR